MANYLNFFETVNEAYMRLRGTIVLYDGEPYLVLCITNHMDDGIWRIYLEPIGEGETAMSNYTGDPSPSNNYGQDSPELGPKMDKWMDKMSRKGGPGAKVIRKMMNSPKFNKFRPFPLGMCNYDGTACYIERCPTRKSEQGLTRSMLTGFRLNLDTSSPKQKSSGSIPDVYGHAFLSCIKGDYPCAEDCLKNLKDPDIINNAAAFHRNFALIRGPLRTLFLVYKTDVVGLLPNQDFSIVKLGREFGHTREAVEDLKLFQNIITD